MRSCTATAAEVGEARHPHNSTSLGEEMGRLDTLLEEASMAVAFQTEVVEDFVVEETSKEVDFQTEVVEDFEVEEASKEVFLKGIVIRVVEFSSGGTKFERFLSKKTTHPKEIIEF